MIRDPSDGSVSGLPIGSEKPKDITKLEKSRAWLSFKALDWLMQQDGEACTATEVKVA